MYNKIEWAHPFVCAAAAAAAAVANRQAIDRMNDVFFDDVIYVRLSRIRSLALTHTIVLQCDGWGKFGERIELIFVSPVEWVYLYWPKRAFVSFSFLFIFTFAIQPNRDN